MSNDRNSFTETLKFILIVAVIVIPIRLWVAQPFIVNGASMDPTFTTGDYLIIDELSYHFTNPQREQVIVLKYPNDPSTYYIKRIIGLPGETVHITNGKVTIINDENPKGFTLDETYVDPKHKLDDSFSMTLGSDQYFVMGDNRAQSSDSRSWGYLQKDLIVGKPVIRLFPLGVFGFLPGNAASQNGTN